MFKGNKKFIYIFAGVFILIIAAQYLLPKPVNWDRTYLSKDKSPFGCYAIYNVMDNVYSLKKTYNNQTLYNLDGKLENSSSIFLLNDNFNFNKSDIQSLYNILNRGNNVMMVANSFEGNLADTLRLETGYNFFDYYFTSIDSLINKPGDDIKFNAKNLYKEKYQYSKVAILSYFSHFDTTRFEVLATTGKQKACLIKTKIGKGTLFLMTTPDVFGNYFIANHKNRSLAYNTLSLLRNKELVWDEYYKTYNVTNYSPIKFILESDALYAAYLLMLFSIIFYMIFEGRRRQRAIPVIEPVNNTTLEFVNVISHVYFNGRNHQSIAVERIKYFYENVRKKFTVNTNEINEGLINEVAELSGVERKLVKQLFNYCEKLRTATEINEYDLIELNRQITNFNKNSLR